MAIKSYPIWISFTARPSSSTIFRITFCRTETCVNKYIIQRGINIHICIYIEREGERGGQTDRQTYRQIDKDRVRDKEARQREIERQTEIATTRAIGERKTGEGKRKRGSEREKGGETKTRVSGWLCECVSEWVSEWANDWVTESEWESDRVRVSEEITESDMKEHAD